MQTVYIGANTETPLFVFDSDSIISINTSTAIDPTQSELSVDTAEIVLRNNDTTIKDLEWATPVFIYEDTNFIGKFYFTKVERIGIESYKLTTVSAIGLLDYDTYYGGIFTGQTFREIVENILETNGLTEFTGISNYVHRGKHGIQTDPDDFCAVKYSALPDSTFNDELRYKATFRLNACLLNDPDVSDFYSTKTSARLPLWGRGTETLQIDAIGIYMNISRASVNDDWPDFGEVFFRSMGNEFSLGTPTGSTIYTLDFNPQTQTATINGVDYQLEVWTTSQQPIVNYAFGGVLISNTLETKPICCDIEYFNHEAYRWDAEKLEWYLLSKPAVFIDRNGNLYPGDAVQYYVGTTPLEYAEVADEYVYSLQSTETYTVDIEQSIIYGNDIDQLQVYGWIPVCSKREALHQLLLSQGVSLIKNGVGNILFTYLSDTISGEIVEDATYLEGSEEQLERVNGIEVTEHGFVYNATHELETVYENSSGSSAMYYVAVFNNGPVYGVPESTGLQVIATNCNAAIVAGIGYLKAVPYIHDQSVVFRKVHDYKDGKVVSLSDATLVTAQNSEAVLDRLQAYYDSSYIVSNDIVYSGEKSGLYYRFTDPFRQLSQGFLTKLESNFSKLIRSSCEFTCGYIPSKQGGFTNYVLLTGNGTWSVPEEVFEQEHPRIRVVVIGGGTGGDSGFAGADGVVTQRSSSSNPSDGGRYGDCGQGGKIYDVVIQNPAASYSYTSGIGGIGGDVCTSHDENNPGASGTDTIFTDGINSYSSSSGSVSENGYTNFLTGDIYAIPYQVNGWGEEIGYQIFTIIGSGGHGGYILYEDGNVDRERGGVAYLNNDVIGFPGLINGTNYPVIGSISSGGGCGGGGAIGTEEAGRGTNASSGRAGNGGNGADAVWLWEKPTYYNDKYYGYGGHGGCGGGGGGNSGWVNNSGAVGTAGEGGYGGKGGDGADGCILIYY